MNQELTPALTRVLNALYGQDKNAPAWDELRALVAIATAARKSVQNPAWAGICDEDIELEAALKAGGFLEPT